MGRYAGQEGGAADKLVMDAGAWKIGKIKARRRIFMANRARIAADTMDSAALRASSASRRVLRRFRPRAFAQANLASVQNGERICWTSTRLASLQISFQDEELRQLCESSADTEHGLGVSGARNLQARLADIISAENMRELIVGKARTPAGYDEDYFIVDIGESRVVLLKSIHAKRPISDLGGIDLSRVTRVKIVGIKTIGENDEII